MLMREGCEGRSWSKEWSSTIKYNSFFLILTHQIDWFSGVQDTWDDDVSLAQILCFFF
jgi:hypothetical protein